MIFVRGMGILAGVWLLHVACAGAYLAMAAYLLASGPRVRLNWTCAGITLCFCFWSACLAVSHHPRVSRERAELFYNIGSFAWASFASFAALFTTTFLRPNLLRAKWFTPALVIPPVIVIWAQWSGRLAQDYIERPWGYAYVWYENAWTYFFYGYYWLYMGVVLSLLLRVSYKTEDSVLRRQARIISGSAWVPLVLSSTTDVLLPRLGIYVVPNMAPDFTVIWVAGLVYAIVNYQMLELTPSVAADQIVANMSDGLLLLDPEQRVVRSNGSAQALLERDDRALRGSKLEELFPARLRREQLAQIGQRSAGRYDLVMSRKGDTEIEVGVSISEMRGTANELVGIVCLVSDISERKREEALLHRAREELEERVEERTRELLHEVGERKRSEERYRLLLESLQEGLWVIDASDKTTFVSANLTEMLGLASEDVLGRTLVEFAAAPAPCAAALERAHRGESVQGEWEILKKDGSRIHAVIRITPLCDDAGAFAGAVSTVVDITDQKRMQTELAQSDRLASLGFLAAGMGHEINNPLSYVIGNLEELRPLVPTLKQNPSNEELTLLCHRLDEALDGARRVRDIVKDLRAFSRVEGRDAEPLDSNPVVKSALRLADKQLRFRARLVTELSPVPFVVVNEGQLSQVLVNLLVNAAHAIEEGAPDKNQIRVASRAEGDEVVIEVSDTGQGIAPEHLSRLFDPFFSTKAPSGPTEGAAVAGVGLGLAISHRLVSAARGRIEVESTLGRGSTFRVRLPAYRGPAPEPKAPPTKTVEDVRARVLVIDDEAQVRKILERVLSKSCEVVSVSSAAAALELFATDTAFDVVFCDLMMPTTSGMDLAEQVKESHADVAERMVFMTGGAFTPKAEEFLANTRHPPLSKPFDLASIASAVKQVVGAMGTVRSRHAP